MAKPAPGRLVGIRARGRAGLLRSTALQAAVLVAIELPGGVRPAVAQPAPNARPMGGRVVAGQAGISYSPGTTTIDQSTNRAAIDWNTFNVGRNQRVEFEQPSSSAWTLNRVDSADPSQIAGRIDANGNIILTNPSGVVFYRGSEVNAQSVVISAPGITNRNFMAGRMVFDQKPHPNARIVNSGSITVKQAGLAALVAPQVRNSGVINAKLGKVVLAGATAHTLDMYGDGLLSFDVTGEVRQVPRGRDGKPVTALVTNTGTILASGGTVQITARAADGIVQNLVDARGAIRADTAGTQTGKIEIDGTGGSLTVAGNISATGSDPSSRGGDIALNATRRVVLTDQARVDASGGAGGGTIALGTTLARAKGGPGVTGQRTARRTIVKQGAVVSADATDTGDGGRVTLLSSKNTAHRGKITARGGPRGGDGGMVEVSGDKGLSLTGDVDVSNRGTGKIGTILLDPTNLTVVSGSAGSGNADGQAAGGIAFDASPDQATVSNGQLNALGGNIVLQASNDLDVTASFTGKGSVDLRAGHLLTVEAGVTLGGIAIRLDGGSTFPISNPAALPTGNGGVIVNGVVTARDGLEIAGGSLGVRVNGQLSASTQILLAATGPAGLQFGAGSGINAGSGGIVDLSTIRAGNITQDPAGQIIAGTLQSTSGVAGNTDLPSTSNQIFALGNFAATGSIAIASFIPTDPVSVTGTLTSNSSISLDIGGPLTVSGVIDAPSVSLTAHQFSATPGDIDQTGGTISGTKNVVLTADGSIDQTGGIIVAGTLSGSSGNKILPEGSGATTLPSTGNAIANLGAFSSVGGFTLTDGVALTAFGPITDTAQIGVNVTGALTLSGTLDAPLVSLVASGDISQPSGAIIATTQLSGSSSAGSIALDSASNQIGGVGSFTSSGDFSLASSTLSLSEPISVGTGHTLDLIANSITFNPGSSLSGSLGGALVAPSGTVVLEPLTAGWPVDFGSANNAGSLDILPSDLGKITTSTLQIGSTRAGPVNIGDIGSTFTDNISLAPITTLNVQSGSSVRQNGIFSVATLTGSANSVTLTNANSIDVLGSFGVTNDFALTDSAALRVTGPVDPTNVTLTAPSLAIASFVSASGTVDLIAINGAVTEPGGSIAADFLTGSGTAVSLASPANAIGTLGAFAATSGDFALADSGDLVIGGGLSGATVDLAVTGAITEASGGSITSPVFLGSAGSATLDQAG